MEIEAIPTEYAGVVFRSKLEATWARFFDFLGIAWEYEPCVLPGWMPDFLLDGWWLAEVKPVPVASAMAACEPVFQKALRQFDTVLLGDGPGDGIGLLVRKTPEGKLFTRYLMANTYADPIILVPTLYPPPYYHSPLTTIWRGLSERKGQEWQSPPFSEVVWTARDAMMEREPAQEPTL